MTKSGAEKKNTKNSTQKNSVQKAETVTVPEVAPASNKKVVKGSKKTEPVVEKVVEKVAEKVVEKKGAKKVVKKAAEKQVGGAVKAEKPKAQKRYFKCIRITKDGNAKCSGRYFGKKPKQSANKACQRIFKSCEEAGEKLPEQIVFCMHECTRSNKKKKKYYYIGQRVELEEPLEVPIKKKDGTKITIKYYHNNVVKKLQDRTCDEYNVLCKYDVQDDEEDDVEQEEKPKVKKVVKKVVKKAKSAAKSSTKGSKTGKTTVRVSKKNTAAKTDATKKAN